MISHQPVFSSLFAAFLLASSAAQAAEVSKTPNEEMRCYLSVEGPIAAGDAEKIRTAMAEFPSDHPEDTGLFYPNSMNSWRKVCFDSPGGSFSEGVEIAQYLLAEQIGSAVPRDAECISACAVAFMGGTNDTKGDGGSVPFRQLHPLGKLGFHAPFIEVPERDYSGAIVQQAFEGALANIGFLLSRGDEMKFPRSLVLRMLQTPSDKMHYVETVGEASRWGIGIAPVVPRTNLEQASVVNACYNQEAYLQDNLMEIYAKADDVVMKSEDGTAIGTLPFGFRGELSMPCRIVQPPISEYDRYSALTHRAIHDITEYEGVYPFQFYDPLTPVSSLADRSGEPPQRVQSFEQRNEAEAVCLVFDKGQVMDSEPCRWEMKKVRTADLTVEETWHFHWPSGSETIVARNAANGAKTDTLNGGTARRIEAWDLPANNRKAIEEAAQILGLAEDRWLSETCWHVTSTNRLFCVGSSGDTLALSAKGFVQ